METKAQRGGVNQDRGFSLNWCDFEATPLTLQTLQFHCEPSLRGNTLRAAKESRQNLT